MDAFHVVSYLHVSHISKSSAEPQCLYHTKGLEKRLVICLLNDMAKLYFLSAVPRKIAGANVVLTAASNILHIYLHVSSHYTEFHFPEVFLRLL